jgi:hypothetical protein
LIASGRLDIFRWRPICHHGTKAKPSLLRASEPPSLRASEPPSLRASEPPSLRASEPRGDRRDHSLDQFVRSSEWQIIQACLAKQAQRLLAQADRDEARAEATFRIVARVSSGGTFSHPAAYAAKVMRSVAGQMAREQFHLLEQPELVVDCKVIEMRDCLVGKEGEPVPIRGRRRQQLAASVRSGLNCNEIATALGQPVKEVRRQVLALAEHLRLRVE